MQTKLQQRVVGAGVLILFLLPTLIMVIYHVLSAPPRSKTQPIAVTQQLANPVNATDASNVHTVQLQLPSSQAATPQATTSQAASSQSPSQIVDNSATVLAQKTPMASTTNTTNTADAAAIASADTNKFASANTVTSSSVAATVITSTKPTQAVQAKTPTQAKPATPTVLAKQDVDTSSTQSKTVTNTVSQPVTGNKKPVPQSAVDHRKAQVTTQVIQQVAAPSPSANKAPLTQSKQPLQQIKTAAKSNVNLKTKKRSNQQAVVSVSQARDKLLKASLAGVSIKQAWVVQVASFSQKSNAKMLLSKLRHAGFHAYSRQQASLSGKLVNQVFVGPEVRFTKMQAIQTQLKKQFKLNGLIRQYNI